jgi:HSP20 family protein
MTYYYFPYGQMMRRRMMDRLMGHVSSEYEFGFPMDIKVTNDGYEMYALLPGVKSEDFSVEFANDVVTIKGEFRPERDEKANYLLEERPDGKFLRTIQLPDSIDSTKVEAILENGVLKVIVPKAESAKPRIVKVVAK